ncbi:unnamed protein product [Pleuronectes platessa]|uniref:Uncharacterized protein n=1 Tax=Pleuronectes platessa TaxID=8262 RepID=A0A9N7UXK9_PLEPL|nr:unnamed protein product [Pleuronectes platessa]
MAEVFIVITSGSSTLRRLRRTGVTATSGGLGLLRDFDTLKDISAVHLDLKSETIMLCKPPVRQLQRAGARHEVRVRNQGPVVTVQSGRGLMTLSPSGRDWGNKSWAVARNSHSPGPQWPFSTNSEMSSTIWKQALFHPEEPVSHRVVAPLLVIQSECYHSLEIQGCLPGPLPQTWTPLRKTGPSGLQ